MDRQHRLKTRQVLALGVALVCSACGSSEPAGEAVFDPPSTPVAQPEHGPEAASIYDAEGNLREGDVVVAGLRLPRGLETKLELGRRHVYETRVPLEKVQRYFGPRLRTGNVTRVGESATFRSATPRDATGAIVKLDVSIGPAGAGVVHVDIYELPPSPPHPLSEAEVRAAIEREDRARMLGQ